MKKTSISLLGLLSLNAVCLLTYVSTSPIANEDTFPTGSPFEILTNCQRKYAYPLRDEKNNIINRSFKCSFHCFMETMQMMTGNKINYDRVLEYLKEYAEYPVEEKDLKQMLVRCKDLELSNDPCERAYDHSICVNQIMYKLPLKMTRPLNIREERAL